MKELLIDGVVYRIGTSAKDNTQLIKDSHGNWSWFHLEKFPSCHVIICKDSCDAVEISQAASLVKEHSKYKFKHIGVQYCKVDNLILCAKAGAVTFVSNRQVKCLNIP